MNLTFGPMHIVGLQGQPRRMYNYQAGYGHEIWNLLETIGSLILAIGVLLFIINVVKTNRRPADAPLDPWDARSLEWITSSPPKEYNFERVPTVHTLDEFFHRKYQENHETGEIVKVTTAEELLAIEEANTDANMHMPSPSYWPMVLAGALPVLALGTIYKTYLIAIIGGLIAIVGAYGWANEPSVAEPGDYDPPAGTSKELAPLG